MDSRAKQRLTGAIILVALFVLLVPELLTGPGSRDPQADAAEDAGLRSYTINLDGRVPATSAAEPATEAAVALPTPQAQPSADALAEPGEAAAPAAAALDPESAVVDIAPAPRADVQPAPVATPPPVTAAAPPAATRVESPRPAAAATTPVAATSAGGRFAVQLGSFGSRENADRLVRDMNSRGFSAFIAPIKSGGRELYRVRVGPTRDRTAAEALAVQLRRIGQSGSIVPIS